MATVRKEGSVTRRCGLRDSSITRTGWGGSGKSQLLESVERTRDTSYLQGTGKLLRILTTKTQERGEARVPGCAGTENSRTNKQDPD